MKYKSLNPFIEIFANSNSQLLHVKQLNQCICNSDDIIDIYLERLFWIEQLNLVKESDLRQLKEIINKSTKDNIMLISLQKKISWESAWYDFLLRFGF